MKDVQQIYLEFFSAEISAVSSLGSIQAQLEKSKESNRDQIQAYKTLSDEHKSLREDYKTLKVDCNTKDIEVRKGQTSINGLDQKLQISQEEVRKVALSAAETTERLKSSEAEREKCAAEFESLQSRIKDLEHQISQLERTTRRGPDNRTACCGNETHINGKSDLQDNDWDSSVQAPRTPYVSNASVPIVANSRHKRSALRSASSQFELNETQDSQQTRIDHSDFNHVQDSIDTNSSYFRPRPRQASTMVVPDSYQEDDDMENDELTQIDDSQKVQSQSVKRKHEDTGNGVEPNNDQPITTKKQKTGGRANTVARPPTILSVAHVAAIITRQKAPNHKV